jgi:predicted metal-dependent hydrolase
MSEIAGAAPIMTAAGIEELFQRGIDLFNQGRYFEAHEVWEQAWLRSRDEEKLFYQGLIQAAAAILHAQRGNPDGCRRLWEKASHKLAPLAADFRKIALGELRPALDDFFRRTLGGQPPPAQPPQIRRL